MEKRIIRYIVIFLSAAIVFLSAMIITMSVFADETIDYKTEYETNGIAIIDNENTYSVQDIKSKQTLFELTAPENDVVYVIAKKGLNIRSLPTINSEPKDTVVYGTELKRIGVNNYEGFNWDLIEYNGQRAFVWNQYLSEEKPAITQASAYKSKNADSDNSSNNNSGMTYLGSYQITAYEWTGYPCANGNYPQTGYTVACNSLPLGTRVYIDGVGYRTVEDRGATWHSSNWMDLYLGDVDMCNDWGIQYRDVYIIN